MSAKSIHAKLTKFLLEQSFITKNQLDSFTKPERNDDIIPFLRNDAVSEEAIQKALNSVMTIESFDIYYKLKQNDQYFNGSQNDCLWIYLNGNLYLSNPFGVVAEKILRTLTQKKGLPVAHKGFLSTKVKLQPAWGVEASANLSDQDATSDEDADKLLDGILSNAVIADATDIHISMSPMGMGSVKLRIDKHLKNSSTFNQQLFEPLVNRIMARCNTSVERPVPQSERFTHKVNGESVSFRVARHITNVKQAGWDKVTLRVMQDNPKLLSLKALELSPKQLTTFDRQTRAPSGLMLCSGPVNTGKSTVLRAALRSMQEVFPEKAYYSAEDPVEVHIPNVWQADVTKNANGRGMSYKEIFYSLMRQDPDVIYVGELRKTDEMELVLEMALTGHYVMSTTHATTSHATFDRFVRNNIDIVELLEAMRCFTSNRLVRRLCNRCKKEVSIDDYPNISKIYKSTLLQVTGSDRMFVHQGCDACDGDGYKGLKLVMEILSKSQKLEDYLRAGDTPTQVRRQQIHDGTFDDFWIEGMRLVHSGHTSIAQLARALPPIMDDRPFLIDF